MAAGVSIKIRHQEQGLRPLNPLRDLRAVVELVEIGFRQELDPQGWQMLQQMRRRARRNAPRNVLDLLFFGEDSTPTGFVWVEGPHIVGNLSLRHAYPGMRQGRLIGNVVVHPEYRGRGIGRALVETGIETARAEGARWVGLEVREGNTPAQQLYSHLGFREVGNTFHLLRPAGLAWPDMALSTDQWRSSGQQDGAAWAALADSVYSRAQRAILEIRPQLYAFGGWERWLDLWVRGQREWAWLQRANPSRLAVRVCTDRRDKFQLWELLVQRQASTAEIQATLAQALGAARRTPPWAVVAIVDAQTALAHALSQIGFHHHRTLTQMMLEFP